MKKISLFILSFLIFSCSSDDDSESENTDANFELLTNQWFFIKSQDLDLPEGEQEYIANECEQNRFIQFSSNGTYIEQFYYLLEEGCVDDGTLSGTFKLSNSIDLKLIESDGNEFIYKIRSINDKQLSVEYLKDNEVYTYIK